ncbi:MAG: aminotransferase class IV family protein [Candidatus Omnitrophica bacterium]|nr:aminotransferase class IV family protein [Candidatus Omnitrophota bacterium]
MKMLLYSQGKEISDKRRIQKFSTEEVGLFETLRVYHGKIFRLEEHLDRLFESAKTVGYVHLPDRESIRREMTLALDAFQEKQKVPGTRRYQVPSGLPDIFIRPTFFNGEIFVMLWKRVIPAEIYKQGMSLKTTPVRRSDSHAWPAQVKTSAFHHGVLASLAPSAQDFEWLMLDVRGFATEVRSGNLFMAKDGRLLTPPVSGVLNGVTRLFVIECALQSGIPVEEKPLMRHEIFNADEVFLTNTSWEILPVCELDGRRMGKKIPGTLTQKLQRIFKKKVLQECPPSRYAAR